SRFAGSLARRHQDADRSSREHHAHPTAPGGAGGRRHHRRPHARERRDRGSGGSHRRFRASAGMTPSGEGRRVRVAVLYGGRSAEHEVSVVSARSFMAAIDRTKYEVVPIAVTKDGRWMLPARAPEELEAPTGRLPETGDEGTGVALERARSGATLKRVDELAGPALG